MAWDFSTDPDFQEQLDWMAQFVRDEIWPLETLVEELDQAALDRIYEPLQQRVRERGLWAAHLDPELGGQGFGQLKLGLMHEILGSTPFAPNAFGCQAPDSGNAEILYEDVRIPAENRLGGEGEGFLISQQRLYPGRIHHCMRWLGVAQRAFDMLCERATYRAPHGKTLGEHQTVQNWIADSAAQM